MLRRLVTTGAPKVLLQLCFLLLQHLGDNVEEVDAFETFSGMHAVTTAHRRRGLRAVTFDVRDRKDSLTDMCATAGFVHACTCACSLREGASQSFNAPVCATWGWVNRGTSRRTPFFILGDTEVDGVAAANLQVSRVVLILYIYEAQGVWWVLEQPRNSLLEQHPRFQSFLSHREVFRTRVDLGSFGSSSQKPLWLYSNKKWVGEISRYASRWWDPSMTDMELVQVRPDSTGALRVYGVPKSLHESQHYPPAFGEAVATVHVAHLHELYTAHAEQTRRSSMVALPELWTHDDNEDMWDDAEMSAVMAFLTGK